MSNAEDSQLDVSRQFTATDTRPVISNARWSHDLSENVTTPTTRKSTFSMTPRSILVRADTVRSPANKTVKFSQDVMEATSETPMFLMTFLPIVKAENCSKTRIIKLKGLLHQATSKGTQSVPTEDLPDVISLAKIIYHLRDGLKIIQTSVDKEERSLAYTGCIEDMCKELKISLRDTQYTLNDTECSVNFCSDWEIFKKMSRNGTVLDQHLGVGKSSVTLLPFVYRDACSLPKILYCSSEKTDSAAKAILSDSGYWSHDKKGYSNTRGTLNMEALFTDLLQDGAGSDLLRSRLAIARKGQNRRQDTQNIRLAALTERIKHITKLIPEFKDVCIISYKDGSQAVEEGQGVTTNAPQANDCPRSNDDPRKIAKWHRGAMKVLEKPSV